MFIIIAAFNNKSEVVILYLIKFKYMFKLLNRIINKILD